MMIVSLRLKPLKSIAIRLLLCLLMLSLVGTLAGCSAIFMDHDYPQPQITYGEFPFELVYSFEGEITTVKGVYICEYTGLEWNWNIGTYRTWNGYIEGYDEKYDESAIFITEDSDRIVFCFIGDAEFYMNDEQYPEKRPLTPRLYHTKKNLNIMYSLNSDEIAALYNIEIVSWKFSEPIENSFE